MRTSGKRLRAIAWTVGQLVLAVAIASCSASDQWIAPTCGPTYMLGCVGDGRPASETTPGSLPTKTCAKEALTLFKVWMTTSSPRDDIAQCRLRIDNSSGEAIAEYALPSGSEPSGKVYGCSLGQTKTEIGYLSYSSCCTEKDTLRFHLEATSSTDEVVQEGSADGICAHYPPEVAVDLRTQLVN
jgi:hypothetical protein